MTKINLDNIHMTNSLKYPEDRFNGFVQLTDGNGEPYVADFVRSYDATSDAGNAMKFAGAWLILAKRIQEQPRKCCDD